jgi:hypothetical protein
MYLLTRRRGGGGNDGRKTAVAVDTPTNKFSPTTTCILNAKAAFRPITRSLYTN